MLFELIATIAAGLGAAGLVLLLGRLSGGRLARWLMPVAAGLAMIGYTIWSEYSWFGRTAETLPEGMVVIRQNDSRAPWRPWTYVWPMVNRFAAIDTASIRTNDRAPELRIVDIYLWGRWSPIGKVTVAFDCATRQSAPLVEGISFGADGRIENADWRPADEADRALDAACGDD